MSFFLTLVVTKDDTLASLNTALRPFGRYETTGFVEYVQDIDVTDEVVTDWNEHGALIPHRPTRPGTARGTLASRSAIEESNDPAFIEWFAQFYGEARFEREGRFYRRTNPNGRWNSWIIATDPIFHVTDGREVSATRKDKVDVEAMRVAARCTRRRKVNCAYQFIQEKCLIRGEAPWSREEITQKWGRLCHLVGDLRAQWVQHDHGGALWDWMRKENAELRDLCDAGLDTLGWWGCWSEGGWQEGHTYAQVPEGVAEPFEWAEKAPTVFAHALLNSEGIWQQRGRLGWFGSCDDARIRAEWDTKLSAFFETIEPHHYLRLVRCYA
jgi:hypothetical protein